MTNCQSSRGKRRRSGPLEDKTSEKRVRYDAVQPVASSSASDVELKNGLKKKRSRKRTKGLRELIKKKIEVALRTSPSPLGHLFTSQDDAGTPQAPFVDVIKAIGLSEEEWLKAASLPARVVESISNITDMFSLERSPEKKLMLKYRPTDWNVDDCTLYLDNLPQGCTSEKICRVARKFGSVVEVRLPRSSSRTVPSLFGVMEVGRRPKSFAFLQFTEPAACERMCAAFAPNTPIEGRKHKAQSLVPLLQRLLMKIRILSRRRRRRTYAQNVLLVKLRRQQAAIINKERSANKRTHKQSRVAGNEKLRENSGPENGKIALENDCTGGEHDTSHSGSCEHRRPSFRKRKRLGVPRSSSQKQTATKRKRKRRQRRHYAVGPHTIVGSVSDYFAKMQVFTLARYRELRAEYVALQREADRRLNEQAGRQPHFVDFSSNARGQTLKRRLGSYRDSFWDNSTVKKE